MSTDKQIKSTDKEIKEALEKLVKGGKLVKFKRSGKIYYQEAKSYMKIN